MEIEQKERLESIGIKVTNYRKIKYSKTAKKSEFGYGAKHKRVYGITEDEYEYLVSKQYGCCAICKEYTRYRLFVDHCHETNIVRGLLCRACNMGLGHFRDSEVLLEKAREYLEDSRN